MTHNTKVSLMGIFYLVRCQRTVWGLPHVGSPADDSGGVHSPGVGSGLPVREDILITRTFSQLMVESSPSPEVFKQSLHNSMLLVSPAKFKAPGSTGL